MGCIKNLIHKLFWILGVWFYCNIWGRCRTKDIKNSSHCLNFFIYHFVANSGDIFGFKNNVFSITYVKDVTDSMQPLFSPHKTYDSPVPFYLNFSEFFINFAHSILFLKPIRFINVYSMNVFALKC